MVEIILLTHTMVLNYTKTQKTNPYVEAFFKWWESDLHKTLEELRITGGEPMMSPSPVEIVGLV
jgi:molybdenum cofactor biosynthesis enzyme MoaA